MPHFYGGGSHIRCVVVLQGSDVLRVPPGEYMGSFHATERNQTECEELRLGPDVTVIVHAAPAATTNVVLIAYEQHLLARQVSALL